MMPHRTCDFCEVTTLVCSNLTSVCPSIGPFKGSGAVLDIYSVARALGFGLLGGGEMHDWICQGK